MRSLLLSVLFFAVHARASEPASTASVDFPPTYELFHRLLADPRQVETSASYYRLFGMNLADVALSDSWGLRRWSLGRDGDTLVQADLEGMAYSAFRLSGSVNQFETVDFFANLPVEIRRGRWSARATLYHESSHLGDDYIRSSGGTGSRYSLEGLRAVTSYDLTPGARVYGGTSYLLHRIPTMGRWGVQSGFELTSTNLHAAPRDVRLYLAQDFQSKEALGWNINSNTEAGVRLSDVGMRRAVRVHLDHFEGHSEFGQFYSRRISMNSLAISFDY